MRQTFTCENDFQTNQRIEFLENYLRADLLNNDPQSDDVEDQEVLNKSEQAYYSQSPEKIFESPEVIQESEQ